MEARGFSVTVGDAAASAGVKVPEAQVALNALAHDTGAHLIVTTDGDILYEFPRDMRSRVASKSLRIRAEPALRKAGQAAFYLGRVSFGMALLASTLVSTTAVLALLLAKGDSNDTRGCVHCKLNAAAASSHCQPIVCRSSLTCPVLPGAGHRACT